jgi:hypothetical protein
VTVRAANGAPEVDGVAARVPVTLAEIRLAIGDRDQTAKQVANRLGREVAEIVPLLHLLRYARLVTWKVDPDTAVARWRLA